MALGRLAGTTERDARVTLLVVTPWPLGSRGGGPRLAREVAVAMATHHGWRVHVAAGTGLPGSPAVPVDNTGLVREIRVPLVQHTGARRWWWDRCDNIASAAHLEGLDPLADAARPDVIMYASHYSSAAEQTAAVAARLRTPFVLLPAIHLDHRRHVDRSARRFYRSADLVVCLSRAEREWLVRTARVPAEKVLWLQCGWHGPAANRSRPREHSVRLLTVAAFVRHKQVDHQLRALARMRDTLGLRARLTCAGALADASTLDRLRRLARRLDIEDDVAFRPDVPGADLARLYEDADYFLFTSRSESLGLVVLDAIASGLVPVVYPHPAYGQLVKSSGFGAVANRATPAALAEAVCLAESGLAPPDRGARLNWLRQRTWPLASAPLAGALRRLSASHPHEGSRKPARGLTARRQS